MRHSRRHFLGSTVFTLGSPLMEFLSTPLWKWRSRPGLQAATFPDPAAGSAVTFVDVAKEAGLTKPNVWGGLKTKKYLVEVKGSGVAFFDYDNDGWLDIYLTNGVRFGEVYTPQNAPTSHLYKNNRDGLSTQVEHHGPFPPLSCVVCLCHGARHSPPT
jgi:enediyne biosynthesis protein E4